MLRRLSTFIISFISAVCMYGENVVVSQDSTTVLKEIVVTAQKVKVKEDGMNYTISNIQGSDLADAGTMLDMMAWVPGLSLDAAENIQVFGVSGTPLVYINGVKVTDKSKLSSLSSNMVKKIEVIRAPGAEYPSGTNSVIKITTTIPLKDVLNANLIERANQRNRYNYSIYLIMSRLRFKYTKPFFQDSHLQF